MSDRPTCGRGLAEHSVVPAKLAVLLASLAENLEARLPTIDLDDPNGRTERLAYEPLAAEYRELASRLQAVAQQMAGHRGRRTRLRFAPHRPKLPGNPGSPRRPRPRAPDRQIH